MKIDVHAHHFPESFVDKEGPRRYGVRVTDRSGQVLYSHAPRPSGSEVDQVCSVPRRLQDMDKQRVDVHVLSVLPTMVTTDLEPGVAAQVCRAINDAAAGVVAQSPGRLVAIAHLPMQDPPAAAAELERCVKELGFRGAMIFTNINGMNLDDPSLAPFYAKVQELGYPVFLHPTNVLGQDRLSRYHLGNLIGNPTDTSVAAASLIFGGVLKEFPAARFYLAHGGGSCPLLRGRWEHGWSVRPEAQLHIQRPPSEYFKQLYFDSLTHSVAALEFLVRSVGPERVMLGSDYPADMADTDPARRIADLPGISDAQKDLIYGENAAALFKI